MWEVLKANSARLRGGRFSSQRAVGYRPALRNYLSMVILNPEQPYSPLLPLATPLFQSFEWNFMDFACILEFEQRPYPSANWKTGQFRNIILPVLRLLQFAVAFRLGPPCQYATVGTVQSSTLALPSFDHLKPELRGSKSKQTPKFLGHIDAYIYVNICIYIYMYTDAYMCMYVHM